jgi:hypothetical protein
MLSRLWVGESRVLDFSWFSLVKSRYLQAVVTVSSRLSLLMELWKKRYSKQINFYRVHFR